MKLEKPFIIAEIGSNWAFGDPNHYFINAQNLIRDAARSGASAVKFQFFTHKELYGIDGADRYHFPKEWFGPLSDLAKEKGLYFMCSAFSLEGYQTVDKYVEIHKLASSEMLCTDLQDFLTRSGKPYIVSTGGAHRAEIFTMTECFTPWAILECVAAYPADPKDYAILPFLGLDCPYWGVSDHTVTGNQVAIAAAAMGAMVFESHVGYEHPNLPDYCVSADFDGFSEFVEDIEIGYAISKNTKKVGGRACEKDMLLKWRRRLKATRDIASGEKLVLGENFGAFRSLEDDDRAAPPMMAKAFDGKVAKRAFKPQDGIWVTDVE